MLTNCTTKAFGMGHSIQVMILSDYIVDTVRDCHVKSNDGPASTQKGPLEDKKVHLEDNKGAP